MDSIWTQKVELPHFHRLDGSRQTDVLIIGGGMAGILCAYFLKKAGVDYMLTEGRSICSGITRDTTAKISAAHGLIYDRLLRQEGQEKAAMYLEANQKAVEKYAELGYKIDCDFEEKTSYVYSLENRQKLEAETEALRKLGCEVEIVDTTELPFKTMGAVAMRKQAQFHPLKFISQIASGLHIYENTFVREFGDHTAITDRGNITYKKLIFATHFPVDNKHGMYFLKMYQHRSYVIALENAANVQGMYIDEAKEGLSFRNYGNLLLLGGGSHRTGKKGGGFKTLEELAERYYPEAVQKDKWATQDCMTLDGVPYIGPYSRNMPDCYVTTGFNKWGMTSSMLAAMLLTDQILEKENPYAEVFDPSRSIWKPQLAINACEALVNLLTPSMNRCPHLGCALKWNAAERTWDCPCHGSRFDQEGTVLDNPANGNRN